MKFATLPTTDAAPSAVTGSPFVACFPLLGTYGPPPAVADYTPYPLQYTLSQMAAIWWRWKVLTVAFDSDFTGPLTFELTRRNNTNASYYPSTDPLFTDERQLIYGTPINGGLPAGAFWEGGIDQSPPDRTLNCYVRMMGGAGSIPELSPYPDPTNETAYYFKHDEIETAIITPAMEILLDGFWDIGSEWSILGTSADNSISEDFFTATLDGISVAMTVTLLGGNSQNCTMTITPTEFFTWADADGGNPTWDAGTGERV